MTSPRVPHNPCRLSSLVDPVSATVACTLLSLTTSVAFVFVVQLQNRYVGSALLLASSSFLLQVPSSPVGELKTLRTLFVAWLFFATLVATIYANVLQSIIVAPEKSLVDLSVKEMVHDNFTFMAFDAKALKEKQYFNDFMGSISLPEGGREIRKTWEFMRLEEILSDRVEQSTFTATIPDLCNHLPLINQNARRVLIVNNAMQMSHCSKI